MNEEEKKAFKVINTRTRRLLDELEIEKEDMSDEPKIAYLMQEIRANKTILNLIEKLQKENEEVKRLIAHKNEYTKKLEEDLFENAENYVIPVQKVKDKIEKYKKLSDKFYVKFLESDRYNTDIREKGIKCDAIILALEELIEEREEKVE